MTQPPPPAGPYQQPYPYQPPQKKSRKTLWIILGIIFGLMILTCGGCLAVTGAFFNEVDKAIEEEEKNDKPTEVEPGGAFEHDDYEIAEGWRVAEDSLGDYTIDGLRITNDSDDARSPWLDFTIYKGNELLGSIDCLGSELQPGDVAEVECSSLDNWNEDYDTVKVADAF